MFIRFFSSLFLGMLFVCYAQASSVLPMVLDEILADAAVAFEGICTGNHSELDPKTGLIVTHTTFSVADVLKGSVGDTHTIKQIGGSIGGVVSNFGGTPAFEPGKNYVVFLYGVSSAGFSSPVGLSQGQFTIRAGPRGDELTNGRDFKEMLRPHPTQQLPPGAKMSIEQAPGELRYLDLGDFKQIVRGQQGAEK
jgi:hypothetical protein